MDKKVKIGVIGVGHLGRHHARIYTGLQKVELVGIFDTDMERARNVGKELGIPAYEDIDRLLSEVEAVSVAVPTLAHYEVAMRALEVGRHLLVEKPIAASLVEADDMIGLAEKKGLILQVGHIERFNKALRSLSGRNIEPRFIESHRLALFNPRGADVAVVLDLMIHDIDIVLSLVHSEISDIDALGVAVVSETDDIANARLSFKNGCVANLTASRLSAKKMRKMRIFQKDAYLSLDFLSGETEIYRLSDSDSAGTSALWSLGEVEKGSRKVKILYERPEAETADSLELELSSFISAIRGNKSPVVSGRDGREALKVALEIESNIELNRRVLV